MNITGNNLIGDVVAKDYRTATIFKEHGIDYCCRGNRPINTVVNESKVLSELLKKLNSTVFTENQEAINFQDLPLDLLIDYIEKVHHRYVEQKIQEINPLLEKISEVHGKSHSELIQIENEFLNSGFELTTHMKKEELVLFPFIKKMVVLSENKIENGQPKMGSIQNPINMMEEDHHKEGERFRLISKLTNAYTPPNDACNTFKVAYSMLKEFEENLHQHIHLENNILFPRAIKLESNLLSNKEVNINF